MSDLNWGQILNEQASDPETGAAPAGEYPVIITSATLATASTGSKMIKAVAEITEGPYKGKPIWTNIVFKTDSPGAMKMALIRLAALGVDKNWLASANPSLDAIAAEIKGAEAIAVVEVREWNNEPRNDIKTFRAVSGGTATARPPAPSAGPAPSVAPSPSVPSGPPTPSVTPDTPPAPVVPSAGGAEEEPF